MKKILVLLFLCIAFLTAVNAEDGRKICSSHLIDSTIDGYRMPNAKGNFDGAFKINKERGSLTINAEGISDLDEKVILKSDMKISSITKHDGNFLFEVYSPLLFISEGDVMLGLRNVQTFVHWNTEDKVVYIGFVHDFLEETAITYKEMC